MYENNYDEIIEAIRERLNELQEMCEDGLSELSMLADDDGTIHSLTYYFK